MNICLSWPWTLPLPHPISKSIRAWFSAITPKATTKWRYARFQGQLRTSLVLRRKTWCPCLCVPRKKKRSVSLHRVAILLTVLWNGHKGFLKNKIPWAFSCSYTSSNVFPTYRNVVNIDGDTIYPLYTPPFHATCPDTPQPHARLHYPFCSEGPHHGVGICGNAQGVHRQRSQHTVPHATSPEIVGTISPSRENTRITI